MNWRVFGSCLGLLMILTLNITAQSIGLSNYDLVEGPTFINSAEFSGLTYNPETNSLFAVADALSITEMSLDGCILRTISLPGFSDTEGIVHMGGTEYGITEERKGEIIKVNINANTTSVTYASGQQILLTNAGLPNNSNVGLEGLTYSATLNRFYTIKEKSPKAVYSFLVPSTFPVSLLADVPFDINTITYSVPQTDLAGLTFTSSGNLLILSEEGKSVVEVDPFTGAEISAFDLSLSSQVEGIAIDADNNIYIVAEGAGGASTSIFYKYAPVNFEAPIGTFVALSPGVQIQQLVLPNTHNFQKIIEEGDPLTIGGNLLGNNDFAGYVPIAGSSKEGYLSINHERTVGGVTILDISYDEANTRWLTSSSTAVDFTGVEGTSRNCSGGITPWGTIVSCEEKVDTSDNNMDGYNDLGWAVEVDPKSKMVLGKRYAMGNFQHENAVFHCNRRTVYQGIDNSLGFLYKFVATVNEDLSEGLLYVYKGSKNGAGTWEIVPNATPEERNATVVLSEGIGAENFINIEDVEIGPGGWIYFASKIAGTVYRFQDTDPISGITIPIMEPYVTGIPGADNLAFDCEGNLWIYQDGGDNHIWMVENGTTVPKIFARLPAGSEPTGITFSPDCKFLFMSIQHPSSTNLANQKDITGETINFNKSITVVISRKPQSQVGCAVSLYQATVTSSADDIETIPNGPINLTSTDLELTDDGANVNQWIGLRFRDIQISQGVHITNAYLQFTVDEVSTAPTSLSLRSIQSDDVTTLLPDVGMGLEANALSNSCVYWPDVAPWPTIGAAGVDQQTPDIGIIIEEIIDRPNWVPGNSIGIVIQGAGRRAAESFDGDSNLAAKLVIEFEECEISNCDDYGNRFLQGPDLPTGLVTVGDELQLKGATLTASSQRYTATNTIEMKPVTTIVNGSLLELEIDDCND